MKLVLVTILVLVIANIKTVQNGREIKIWKIVLNFFLTCSFDGVKLHPDTGSNIYQFVHKYNYTLEAYDVVTEDGYILTLHRIPFRKNEAVNGNTTRPVVLLAHCLACSAMDWLFQGPNVSLGFLLADEGYDVWLANTRGNIHSMRHETLTPANASFWEFSFHEKGFYDMASNIDYILNKTKVQKITYVGHSQGTSAGLVLMSCRPQYNDKLNLMVLLSPVVYTNHCTSPAVLMLTRYIHMIKAGLNRLGIYGLEYNPYITMATDTFCNENSLLQGFCIYLIDLFSGPDAEQVDKALLTVFLTNTPSGLSIRDIEHYAQEIKSGEFRQFDFGSNTSNLIHYGSPEPPFYNLSKVTTPLAIYYAKNDFLSSTQDVERFLAGLNTDIVDLHMVQYEYFSHLDFITAKGVKSLLYDRVIKVIQQTNPAK